MTSSLKLEVGKTYRRRDGDITQPLTDNSERSDFFRFRNGREMGSIETFDRGGRCGISRDHDLVEEVLNPAELDPVNQPAHYTQGGVECIDAIKAAMSADEFRGYLRGNVIKYLWRYKLKGGAESLAKAQWYLSRLQTEIA